MEAGAQIFAFARRTAGSFFGSRAETAPTAPETEGLPAPPVRSASSYARTDDENMFIERVVEDIIKGGSWLGTPVGSRLEYTGIYGKWRVDRITETGCKPTFTLRRKGGASGGSQWRVICHGITSSEDLRNTVKTTGFLYGGAGKARSKKATADDSDDQDDEQEEIEVQASGVKAAHNKKNMACFRENITNPRRIVPVDDTDQVDEDDELDEEEGDDPCIKLAQKHKQPYNPPQVFQKFDQKFEWRDDGRKQPGEAGFNQYVQDEMKHNGVPTIEHVKAPEAGGDPFLNPYQQTASFVAHPTTERTFQVGEQPSSYPRLLVVHRTGSGKTATIIRVCDNYFKDRRPKLLLFPKTSVCDNFYKEVLKEHVPNRYAHFMGKVKHSHEKADGEPTWDPKSDPRSALALDANILKSLGTGFGLREGKVNNKMINDEQMPSAPLRAFSYTQAGGSTSCGVDKQINAVFKCVRPI